MVKSFFEEKSYEAAFNNELNNGVGGAHTRHFAPGARLEASLGFDVMAILEQRHPAWRTMGLRYRAGTSLHHRAPSQLPDAVFNLFIQYKRSDALKSRLAMHHAHFGGPYYRFHFNTPTKQLATLHELAKNSGSAAHVIYAAPEFHTVPELWDATVAGEIISKSVIIEAQQLSLKHKAFNFKTDKASLQNPDPEFVEAANAAEWFKTLDGQLAPLVETVSIAHSGVRGVARWRERWESDRIQLIGREPFSDDPAVETTVRQFAEVAAFTWLHGLSWILSGPGA